MKNKFFILLLTLCTAIASVNLTAGASNASYKVSPWAENEVNQAFNLGLIPENMQDDNLSQNITRAEFAAIAVTLYEKIANISPTWHGRYIPDILDHPYEYEIQGAFAYGLTNGTGYDKDGNTLFSPDLDITREQLATMLCRVIKAWNFENYSLYDDNNYILSVNQPFFEDNDKISDYAIDSVRYMANHKIINGVGDYSFAPQYVATKEQALLIALRIFNNTDILKVEPSTISDDFIYCDFEGVDFIENKIVVKPLPTITYSEYTDAMAKGGVYVLNGEQFMIREADDYYEDEVIIELYNASGEVYSFFEPDEIYFPVSVIADYQKQTSIAVEMSDNFKVRYGVGTYGDNYEVLGSESLGLNPVQSAKEYFCSPEEKWLDEYALIIRNSKADYLDVFYSE